MSYTEARTEIENYEELLKKFECSAEAKRVTLEQAKYRPMGIDVAMTERGLVGFDIKFMGDDTSIWRQLYRSDPGVPRGEAGLMNVSVLDLEGSRNELVSAQFRVDDDEPSIVSFDVSEGIDENYRDELFEEVDFRAYASLQEQ